jgi:hypothetical protein
MWLFVPVTLFAIAFILLELPPIKPSPVESPRGWGFLAATMSTLSIVLFALERF